MKILIFGSNGLVGSSLNRVLIKELKNFEIIGATRNDANLFSFSETKQQKLEVFMQIILKELNLYSKI